ncbi:DMT family transporter [Imbroritus primus]|uniref:DMT family transporter n=1 Tax=Imbroritus primus TaxID=3058603 RepID=UPI003D162183
MTCPTLSPDDTAQPDNLWLQMMPWVFVVIWSTGFIIAKYAMPHAEPMTFMFVRCAGVVLCMAPIALLTRVPLPHARGRIDWRAIGHLSVAGLLLQTGYIGGVWAAIRLGMPVGLSALIVGMQPILTAVYASATGEQVSARQWSGLLLGIVGVALVVSNKLDVAGVTPISLTLCVMALLSITVGTIYQKRFCPVFDLRMGSLIQFAAAGLVCLPLMFLFETREIEWAPELIGALLWAVLTMSIGAMSLLFLLIRRGAATSVSALMYLTPPTTALMAWGLFGESFRPAAMAGMVLAAAGVALVLRKPARRA